MKKLFFYLACLGFSAGTVLAQDETLFSNAQVLGGFGGPIIEYSQINKDYGVSAGGGGGVIINDFFLGGFGMGSDFGENILDGDRYNISMGYGGLWLGFVKPSSKVIHLFSSMKIGWGSVSYELDEDESGNAPFKYDENDSIFVLTPEAGLELNIFQWFRIAGTVGYRFVSGVDRLPELTDQDLRGMTLGLNFRFGGF